MKHKNLQILTDCGINVPPFTVVSENEIPDMSFSEKEKFAIRSSYSMEDSENASFAGQFDTFLNVPRDEAASTVRKVYESFSKRTAEHYKNARNINDAGKMYVIVQEMVDAELSGVIFTANPLGILNETVAVIGFGLGNNVVEDKINTTSYFYNRDDDIYYYERQDGSPLISENLLKELIEISSKIKNIFSFEADIEFAVKDDTVFILQARPITVLNTENPIILDNSNIVESYPGVSLPLTQDFVRSVYHGIFYSLIKRITKDQKLTDEMDGHLKNMTDVANWRIYYRISNWYGVLNLLPFSKKIIPMWQSMLGVSNTYVSSPDDIKPSFFTKLNVLVSFVHYLIFAPRYMDKLNEKFRNSITLYRERVERAHRISELLVLYEDIRKSILADWDLTLINDMYTFIYTALAGKKNREHISDIKNLESMKPLLAVNELVNIAKEQGDRSPLYLEKSQEYIEKYGDRCLGELKLETATYRTDPSLLHKYVQSAISREYAPISEKSSEKKSKNIFVKKAKTGIRNREISRLNRSTLFGLSRTIFLKIGDCLVKNSQIDDARDVFYLHTDELTKSGDLRKTVNERKAEHRHYENVAPYSRLVFADHIINKTSIMGSSLVLSKKDVLCGIPSSQGLVVGEVLLVESPDDKTDTTGKILVTRSTDPGWVFLLQGAIGIVAEKGSLLSHTAIISRELGRPAVVNVKDCTKLLKNGDKVELNAYDGTVTLLKNN